MRGRCFGRKALFTSLVSICVMATSLGAASIAMAACGNEEVLDYQEALVPGVSGLPDCMALEMISPALKAGQPARESAISASGDRLLFFSTAALDDSHGTLRLEGDSYVASRTGGGEWVTVATSPPVGIIEGWHSAADARSFSPDFTQWFQLGATQPQTELGIGQVLHGGLGGHSAVFSPLLIPQINGEPKDLEQSQFRGASADHSQLFFHPGPVNDITTSYLVGDPIPVGTGADYNTYLARLDPEEGPVLELLARDEVGGDAGKLWGGRCGTRVGGTTSLPQSSAQNGMRNQGAISVDGARNYFSTRPTQPEGAPCDIATNKMRILVRTETEAGSDIKTLFSSQCARVSPPCEVLAGDDLYQGASRDGSRVYFLTNRQLTDSDLDGTAAECTLGTAVSGCDLYLYEPEADLLTQVSAGEDVAAKHETGKGAGVYGGIAAISTDGSHVYFVAKGALTDDANPEGAQAEVGEPNLYLYERSDAQPEGRLAFIGALDSADAGSLWGSEGGTFRNRAYPVPASGGAPDGHVLLFFSRTPLTADDDGAGKTDVFRYDSEADALICMSCGGEGPEGDAVLSTSGFSQAPGTDLTEVRRWASEDGEAAVFVSAERLLPGDDNEAKDTYLWRNGQLYLLPGTTEKGGFIDGPAISRDGTQAAFATFAPLLPSDGDTTLDVYALRANGGALPPPPIPDCDPDGDTRCQGPASPPLAFPGPAACAVSCVNARSLPDCRSTAKRALRLSREAKRLRRRARRVGNARRARRLRRKARRAATGARIQSKRARRCRGAVRRSAK